MILGIPLLKGELDDGRVIFYLEEEIRRKFQRMGFIIKAFVPSIEDKIFREDLEMVNGVYLPDGDYDKNIPIYGDDDFINKCKKRKVNYKKKKKIVGIISKYTFDNDISRVYLIDKVRKTIFLAGANIDFIIPIQDVDYPTTRGKDYPNLVGCELVRQEDLDSYELCNHVKVRDVNKVGISRGNARYRNDRWEF